LLNQLLGTHPDCYVLSEVNPAASFIPLVEQAEKWLRLVEPAQMAQFRSLSYTEKIGRLDEGAKARGKRLLVRDFSAANFVPGCVPNVCPSGVLEQELYLRHAGFDSVPLVIARRALDTYSSWTQNFEQFREMEMGAFADSYLRYAEAVKKYPVIHLESLQADPESAVAQVLRRFGLDEKWQSHMLENFHSFTNCSGNNTLAKASPSTGAKVILNNIPGDRRAFERAENKKAMTELAKADRWFGYE